MQTSRFDLFSNIHKAVRLALADLLARMGAADFADETVGARIAADLELVLAICEDHRRAEDEIVLPTLRTRMSGDLVSLLDAHEDHAQMVVELTAAAKTLLGETAENRPRVGRTMYLHFSKLAGELLLHMAEEEQVAAPLFDRLFTPEEILAIYGKLMASLPPDAHMRTARFILRAVNRSERVALMTGALASFPKEAVVALVDAGFAQ